MSLIDTHCHIYSTEFAPDLSSMIARALSQDITTMLMPAIDSSTHSAMHTVEDAFQGNCLSMMGLHPCSVKANFRQELEIVEDYFSRRRFIGVGETGLDFYWDLTFKAEQCIAFEQQIDWAIHYDVPVVIHSRNSIDECIKIINEKQNGNLKGVFHCFSGSLEQARRIIDLNFHLGIGGVLTYKKSGLEAVLSQIDLNKIVLETDSPYLAPVPFRGKRNECSYLRYIAEKLAEVKQLTLTEVAAITTQNTRRLFNLDNLGYTRAK